MVEFYYIIKVEFSNGFPNPSVITTIAKVDENDNTPSVAFNTLCKYVTKEAGSTYAIEQNEANRFFISEQKHSGNGIALFLKKESDMEDEIMKAVDASKDIMEFEHFGDTYYKLDVPVVNMQSNLEPCSIMSCGEERYKLECIYRRPCDTENKDDDEYVYDVQMARYESEYCDSSCTYIDSLDCVGSNLFGLIWAYVTQAL